MSRLKVALLSGAVVCLLAGAGLLLLMHNLDSLVRDAIETAGSSATGTAVRVGSVSISLREGVGTISGLTVANPPGFSAQPLFTLDSITVKLDPAAITSEVPVIEELRIGASTFRYEINAAGETNLRIVQKQARQQARQQARPAPEAQGGVQPESRRLRIKRLVIADGTAHLDLGKAGSGRGTARVPGLTMIDVGGAQGATAEELAAIIVRSLGDNLAATVGGGIFNRLGDAVNDAYRKLLKR